MSNRNNSAMRYMIFLKFGHLAVPRYCYKEGLISK